MPIKNKDFIELEYTAKLADGGIVFDTTNEKIAKENKIERKDAKFGPVVVCIGEGQLLKGLEKGLEGKELGNYTFTLQPEDAFGKKTTQLIQMVPTKTLLQNKIQPFPGLQVNMDGVIGTIRTVSGGRTIVDFNNPLSGKEVVYELKVNKIITDKNEKLKTMLEWAGFDDAKSEIINDEAKIELKKLPQKELQEQLSKKIQELLDVKKVEFSEVVLQAKIN